MSQTAPVPINASRPERTPSSSSASHKTPVDLDLEFDLLQIDSGRISGVLSPGQSYTTRSNKLSYDAPTLFNSLPSSRRGSHPDGIDESHIARVSDATVPLSTSAELTDSGEFDVFPYLQQDASESESEEETASGDEFQVRAIQRRHSKSLRLALEHELDVAQDQGRGKKVKGGTYKHSVAARIRHIGFKA